MIKKKMLTFMLCATIAMSSVSLAQEDILIYSVEINGITLNMFHYGDPPYYEQVNIRYAN